MRPYIAQIRSNLQLMARDRAVLFFSYVFPLALFFTFSQMFNAGKDPAAMQTILSMIIVISVLGNGFFGAGMRTVQDRETNVLRRFKVAPITPLPMLISSLVAGLVNFIPTVILYFVIATVFYHMPLPANTGGVIVFVSIGLIAFRALGMIIASVVNSANEGNILIQILYLPMLFLSGATFPVEVMPPYVQVIAGFLPATYISAGMKAMMIEGKPLFSETVGLAIVGLIVTTIVALFLASKLFRWEKEEKIAPRAKLWIAAVLLPFFLLGAYEGKTKSNIEEQARISRKAARGERILLTNARIFVGNGKVIDNGAMLIAGGKIEKIFDKPPAETKSLNASLWDEAGRTIIPGLIDMHVHIGAPGGVYLNVSKYNDQKLTEERLAAYLYCGITAVRSTGDWLDSALQLRDKVRSDSITAADFYTYGPLFTAPGGHPTEFLEQLPGQMRQEAQAQFVRLPKTPAEARAQVDELNKRGMDGIKAVLEAGSPKWRTFNRLQPDIYTAVIAEAAHDNLPSATHTGSVEDVRAAIAAGTNTIEHGSMLDPIPDAVFAEMKAKNIAYDPTLSVLEAVDDQANGNLEPLDRPLVQRAVPSDLIADTRKAMQNEKHDSTRRVALLELGMKNLAAAYRAGVTLIAGSDAGNMLVFHGPTIQHELALWVKAGIPANVAIEAATYNGAQYLRREKQFGSIQTGLDATFVILESNPVQDVSALERISDVFYKGENIQRYKLVHQEK